MTASNQISPGAPRLCGEWQPAAGFAPRACGLRTRFRVRSPACETGGAVPGTAPLAGGPRLGWIDNITDDAPRLAPAAHQNSSRDAAP